MRNIVKLGLWNLFAALALLVVVNVGSGLYLKYAPALRSALGLESAPAPWRLPNYADDPQTAAKIFEEFQALDTRYRAFVGWRRSPFTGKTTTVNNRGDRVNPMLRETDPDAPVARFFGGSTMWGTGVADGDTIPAAFNALRPGYRVFNHGESGFNSRQNIARLLNLYAEGERVDLVVFYNGNNHYTSGCYDGSATTHAREAQIAALVRQGSHVHGSIFRQVFFEYTMRLIDEAGFGNTGGPRAPEGDAETAAVADVCANSLIRYWELARDVVVSRGDKFLAFLQPVAEYGGARIDHLSPAIAERRRAKVSLRREFYDRVRAKITQYDYMHDLSDVVDGDEYIFIDNAHVSARGNALVAARIAGLVAANGSRAR